MRFPQTSSRKQSQGGLTTPMPQWCCVSLQPQTFAHDRIECDADDWKENVMHILDDADTECQEELAEVKAFHRR